MSRSGYSDDIDTWALIRWRGAVKSAIRGRRGQTFMKELLAALDALPEKKLIAYELENKSGDVCALGALGKKRQIDMSELDPEDSEYVADAFNIAEALAREVVHINDDYRDYRVDANGLLQDHSSAERRFDIMRNWVARQIHE
jgi:hypothetical protein